jgi:hypothetical protein
VRTNGAAFRLTVVYALTVPDPRPNMANGVPVIDGQAGQGVGNVCCDAPRLVAGEQLGGRSYRPILPAFAIIVPEGGLFGSKAMEWFKRKTSIAGYEISNWIIVLGAIIIALLIFQNLH